MRTSAENARHSTPVARHGMTTALPSQVLQDFSTVLDHAAYRPLPDDWMIGITDVVDSTRAIREGRYEAVNFAGASVITALANVLRTYDFPFAFAGDGAAFAVPARYRREAEQVLRQVAAFAASELSLALRAGLLSVGDIRAHGRDVRVTRYAVSEHASSYVFSGGGIAWAEGELKNGRYAVGHRDVLAPPDLTGLACEWTPVPSRNGNILSLVVEASESTRSTDFTELTIRVLAVLAGDAGANAAARGTPSTDLRKCDGRLYLTADCSDRQVRLIEDLLRDAAGTSAIKFGTHVQTHAIITCVLPSGDAPDAYLQLLDGYGGGYMKAAAMLSANFPR